MAISKRLRFEILRRDGFCCRYCGASAENTRLVVDHVLPESLGGKTDPSNLVAACHDCNAGKASTHPDDQVVADVAEAAARWKAAMEQAAAELTATDNELSSLIDDFDSTWTQHGGHAYRPDDWAKSIETFLAAGLTGEKIEELVLVTFSTPRSAYWRYFCGCCWRTVDAIRDRSEEILKGASPLDDFDPLLVEMWSGS